MKDVQSTLRRIDDQITAHNQAIARSRVEIAKLQETRLVLMNLAEDDTYAREEAPARLNGGSHSKPMLIVRKVTDDETPPDTGLNKSGNMRGMNMKAKAKPKPPKLPKVSKHGYYKTEVVAFLKKNPTAEFSFDAIIEKSGVGPLHGKGKQPLYQALYELRRDKIVHSPSGPGSYQIAP